MPKFPKKNVRKTSEVSPDALSYKGRVRSKPDFEQQDTTTAVLTYTGNLSSAASVINASYGNDPSNATDWSNFAGNWQQYRVLAWELTFVPLNRYNKATTVLCNPCVVVISRQNSTGGAVLTSYANAVAYESYKIHTLEDPFMKKIHMDGAGESQFLPTNSTSSVSWMKFYADTLTATFTYGLVVISYRVQFRGKA